MTLSFALACLAACAAGTKVADVLNYDHKSQTVLEYCSAMSDTEEAPKQFDGSTLGFVTPWHPSGKAVALRAARRFTYVSPMWFHIELLTEDQLTVRIAPSSTDPDRMPDKAWVNALQKQGTKVIPVFAFYNWPRKTMGQFFLSEDSGTVQHQVVQDMIKTCIRYDCDGLVLEWGKVPVKEYYAELSAWLRRIQGSMTKFFSKPFELMLSVHPDPTFFGKGEFEALAPVIDKFILHTYNFTSAALSSGPNCPMSWMREMLKAWQLLKRTDTDDKVIVTLPFFGREYVDGAAVDLDTYDVASGDPTDASGARTRWDVTGEQYIRTLEASENDSSYHLEHHWNDKYKEHHAEYVAPDGSKRIVYYPSLKALKERIDLLSATRATGLGVWNLGTGLDYFYDLI
ncbi:Chitinase domain-containing protein 1 [Diplonema papillatum]|nr:Chitinase domain-containing protein 1 [Diplonema papillatum]